MSVRTRKGARENPTSRAAQLNQTFTGARHWTGVLNSVADANCCNGVRAYPKNDMLRLGLLIKALSIAVRFTNAIAWFGDLFRDGFRLLNTHPLIGFNCRSVVLCAKTTQQTPFKFLSNVYIFISELDNIDLFIKSLNEIKWTQPKKSNALFFRKNCSHTWTHC